jgi:hypothetical protein
MDCLCYNNRKPQISPHSKKKIDKKNVREVLHQFKKTWKEMDNPFYSNSPELNKKFQGIVCSYILCEQLVQLGKERDAICNKKSYVFCGDKCWENWINSGGNITHSATTTPNPSPLLQCNSPEYLEYFKNTEPISNIPPLFI